MLFIISILRVVYSHYKNNYFHKNEINFVFQHVTIGKVKKKIVKISNKFF